jgi:hypothetical protein
MGLIGATYRGRVYYVGGTYGIEEVGLIHTYLKDFPPLSAPLSALPSILPLFRLLLLPLSPLLLPLDCVWYIKWVYNNIEDVGLIHKCGIKGWV